MQIILQPVMCLGYETGTAKKSGKPYKLAIIAHGAKTVKLFVAEGAPEIPEYVKVSIRMPCYFGFDGTIKPSFDKSAEVKPI